jgi:hypothetical protein
MMRGFERGWWIERPRKWRLAGCRPRIERLEERALAANLPLVVVPGQPGSFPILNRDDPAGAVADMQSFLLSEGQVPGSLTWDFAIHTHVLGTRIDAVSPYVPFVHYLERHGYTLGQDLFVAVADWRLPVAPTDGAADGVLTAETNA